MSDPKDRAYLMDMRSTHVVEMTVHEKNGRPVIELDDIVQR